MDTREFVLREDASNKIVTHLLVKKYGEQVIQGLLADDFCIVPHPQKGQQSPYVRGYQEVENLLDDGEYEGKRIYVRPESLLKALDDAREALDFSNWAADMFDRIGEIVIRHFLDRKIPITFKTEHRGPPA